MEQTPRHKPPKICTTCSQKIDGQFVRTANGHYHIDCFRCNDCGEVVADKFFPVTKDGQTMIYCEIDYFKRLDLICGKCGMALRGPYINALNKKFHMEHFTCSVCPVVFRQHDSYFEKDGNIYCGYHYSVLFAAKCGGCNTAVLKNFVETNKDNVKIQWHPCCYMIFKLWHVKLSIASNEENIAKTDDLDPEQEVERQQFMIEKVERILRVLSYFEESAAECISEMLVYFSNGSYLEGAIYANKFIYHVHVLFSCIEEIESALLKVNGGQSIQKSKEPKQLVKKIIYFFSLLSGNQDVAARLNATKEMISLVTSLAHTLKIIIRGALTGAFKLEQMYQNEQAVPNMLNALESIKSSEIPIKNSPSAFIGKDDSCTLCGKPVEEGCVKYDQYIWHEHCLLCSVCKLGLFSTITSAFVDPKSGTLSCGPHKNPNSIAKLEPISQLKQYVSLLYMAWSRLCALLNIDDKALMQISDEPPDQRESSTQEYKRADNDEDLEDEEPSASGVTNDGDFKPNTNSQWRVNQFSANNAVYLTDLTGLQLMVCRQLAALALHQYVEKHYTLNKLLTVVDASTKKKNIWTRVLDVMAGSKKKKEGTFGKPLELLIQDAGVNCDISYGAGTVRIPMVIEQCIRSLNKQGLMVEGIFRKNGNIKRLKEYCERLDADPLQFPFVNDNSVQIAALIKKFLRSMPEPLLTYRLGELFILSQKLENLEDKKNAVHLLCCMLPKPNLDLLSALSLFVAHVAAFEEAGSKMNLQSLATVLAPNILWLKNANTTPSESMYAVQAVPDTIKEKIIDNYDTIKEPISKTHLMQEYQKMRNQRFFTTNKPNFEEGSLLDIGRD